MDYLGLLGTLRKFGNFIVGLFPFLVTVGNFISGLFVRLVESSPVAPSWRRITATSQYQAIRKVFERFFWRDYSKDRLDLEKLPEDTIPVLRPTFLLSVALCLLIPFCMSSSPPFISMESLTGEQVKAPLYSVMLWLATAALSWSLILSGCTLSNRPALMLCGYLFIFHMTACAAFGERTFINGILPLIGFMTLVFCERSLSTPTVTDRLKSIPLALVIGSFSGLALVGLTPVRYLCKGPAMTFGIVLGCVLSMLIVGIARLTRTQRTSESSLSRRVFAICGLICLFMLSMILRGNLSGFAGALLSQISVWNGFLWPAWYFIGVGIIFKLMKNSKIFTSGVKEVVPSKAFVPAVLLVIGAIGLILWNDFLILKVPVLMKVEPLYVQLGNLYKWSSNWLWHNPVLSMAASWFKWAVLVDLLIIAFLILKRRLDADSAASIFYQTVLCGFLLYEYAFQSLSFSRTPTHSMILLCLFSIWLLWLYHRVGLSMSMESSPLWPARGRLSIYGGVMLLCLLEIYAKCSIQNFKVMNEIFMVMFRGIIDIGLPYFLYVYATRKFKVLPLGLGAIFRYFCLGAALTLPFNALDKLAFCNFSVPETVKFVESQIQIAQTTGMMDFDMALPSLWLLVRVCLFTSLLFLIGRRAKKSAVESQTRTGTTIFALMSFASGFASFSKATMELPLTNFLNILTMPVHRVLWLDESTLIIYFAYWIPALVFGLLLASKDSTWKASSGLFAAFAIQSFFLLLWSEGEVWLQSTDMMIVLLFSSGLVFLLLCWRTIRLMEWEANVKSDRPPVVSKVDVSVFAVVSILALSLVSLERLEQGKLSSYESEGLSVPLQLPARWKPAKDKASALPLLFLADEGGDLKSMIVVSVEPGMVSKAAPIEEVKGNTSQTATSKSSSESPRDTLKRLFSDPTKTKGLQKLSVQSLEDWSKYDADACAVNFTYEVQNGPFAMPCCGVTAARKAGEDKMEIITLLTSPGRVERLKWDVIRAISTSSERPR